MAKTSGASEDRVFDVAKPGKTPPDDSARPVIVGHRTILKDPTLAPVEDAEFPKDEDKPTTTAPELKPPSAEKIVIPISDKPSKDKKKKPDTAQKIEPAAEKSEDPAPEAVEPAVEETVSASETDEKSPPAAEEKTPEPEPTEPEPSDQDTAKKSVAAEEPDTEDASDTGEPDTEANNNVEPGPEAQKQADKKQREDQARQAALEKIVTDKTYFVPIGEVKRKRSNRRALFTLLLLIIMAAVLADLLIDSGTIKTSIKAPVHIFKTNITE